MCAVLRAAGVPEVTACLPRDRLRRRIGYAETRTCFLIAPSGYGKTVVAAQFAAGFPSVLWLDAPRSGARAGRDLVYATLVFLQREGFTPGATSVHPSESMDLADVFHAIETLMERLSLDDLCVVVDDLGDCEAASVMAVLKDLRVALRRRVWFVATARGLGSIQSALVRDAVILDGDDLRLTESEAVSLASSHSTPCGSQLDVPAVRKLCGGHVALFTVLLGNLESQIAEDGDLRHGMNLCLWIQHLISSQLSDAERELLAIMTLLAEGSSADLVRLGGENWQDSVRRIGAVLPLVVLSEDARGRVRFAVHDSVLSAWQRDSCLNEGINWAGLSSSVALSLSERGDLGRAATVLEFGGETQDVATWVLRNGNTMLDLGLHEPLDALLERLPVSTLFAHPRLLLLSSVLAFESDNFEDSLARSRAALALAEHQSDTAIQVEALSRCLWSLCRLGQFELANELATELARRPLDAVPAEIYAASLLAIGIHAAAQGEFELSEQAFARIQVVLAHGRKDSRALAMAAVVGSLLPGLITGDFVESSLRLAPATTGRGLWPSDRLVAKGNLAVGFCEIGRLERSKTLLLDVVGRARGCSLGFILGSYLPALGSVEVGIGDVAHGINLIREGIGLCLAAGDEPDAQASRVYLAIVLRASGEFEASLTEAQRAFEHLSVEDVYNFRRLAALEVSASLLALGDVAAARAGVEVVKAEGFGENRWHAFRAEMILAEADRRDGLLAGAVDRIASHRDYLLSGNTNWPAAMYCRAFPELLGVLALAVGAESLPAHLLKMILPGQAERSLELSRSFLDVPTWRALGMRLLPANELDRLALRDDGPSVCNVRLFGGLDVTIGGRSIREREWRKRKARLLFTMLVTRRGRDVSRDQVCEYLWPDMDEDRAKNNLYVAWSTMKAVLLGDSPKGVTCPYVESVGGVCRVVADVVRTDLDDFESALAAARDAEAAGNTGEAIGHYERLLTIYTGDLLPGDIYDDWFSSEREQFRTAFEDAMLRATMMLSREGNPAKALVFVRRAIHHDPIREDLAQVALRCLIDSGQRNSAVEEFFRFKNGFADELGLDPSPETRALYDEILAMEDRPKRIPANATIDDLPD